MATGGGSIVEDSDYYYEFCCSVCEKKGKNVEAIKRCVDCPEDMCGECLSQHNMFGAMQGHTLIDKKEVGKQDGSSRPDLPRARCNDHPGNKIELYCRNHDEVGCANCINLTHKSCEDRHYIPKVAAGFKNTKEPHTVADSMGKLTKRTERVKKAREEDLKRITAEKNTAVKTVDDQYDVIKKRLDDLRAMSIAEVDGRYKELEKAVTRDVDRSSDVISQLGKEGARLKAAQQGGESDLFVCVKQGKGIVREGEKLVQELEKSGGEAISVTVDDTLLACLNGLEKLATVGRPAEQVLASGQRQTVGRANVGRSAKLALSVEQQPYVRMNGDQSECSITDCCLLDNGNMLLTDDRNKCVKLFDNSYRAVERCAVQSNPQAACLIGTNEVAIAMFDSMNVQIASVDQKIRLTRSFSVGKLCTGASYYYNKLYISCRFNKVRVYDTRGSFLQTVGDGSLSDAFHSIATRNGGCIVTNGAGGIVAFDSAGKTAWTRQHADLKDATGICEVGDWVLVGCYKNGHVFQVNPADQSCSILLHGSGELQKPRSLTYDQTNDKLIVTKGGCDHMLVYKFNR